jgi:hypothetical protein
MTPPVRLQLSRRKGFRLQEHSRAVNGLDAVNCARPGRFGNGWTIAQAREAGYKGTNKQLAEMCVAFFENSLARELPATKWIADNIGALRGKNLACWCDLPTPGDPDICHCVPLLELANKEPNND